MSLATPPSTDAEDGDTSSSSSSSSPHIDTSRIMHEKISANDGGHECMIDSSEYQVQDNVFIATSDQSNCVDIPDFNAVGLELEACCGAGDVALDVIPARMYEACELEEHNRDGNDAYNIFRLPVSQCTGWSPTDEVAEDPIRGAQECPATPLRRISTSSIPHLMSVSRTFSMGGQKLIERQMQQCFAEIEGTLSPSTRSRENSFVFSVDRDDSGFGFASYETNAKQAASPSLESNFSSPAASLDARFHFVPPPCNIPHQACEDMQQQLHVTITCQHRNVQNDVHTTLNSGPTLTSQHFSKQSNIPILYSAINSLERYNAGSFDNKVLLAKARGMHARQKAFPGVPRKGSDPSPSESIISAEGLRCSALDQPSISASARRKSPNGSTLDQANIIQQLDTSPTSIEQIGVEHSVAIATSPSASRIHKSKSSGNLRESDSERRFDNTEELKAFRKSKRGNRSVVINDHASKSRTGRRREKRIGVFRPSSDAYTPRMENRDIKYKPTEERESVVKISHTMGTIQRPNFRDALRRVAIILHQHIVKIESRFSTGTRGVDDTGLFKASMKEQFHEDKFVTPRYKCSMVRVPMARPGVVYSMRRIRVAHATPTTDEIYEFAHQLFKKVQLSSECSIVCLIYVEKLMEVSKVPLVSETWRPIFMCGLLLASKVWQDLSSWNIEFASVYPQFSLPAINRLEVLFLKFIKWDLYISSR